MFAFRDLKLPSPLESYNEGLNSPALIPPLGSLSSMERDRVRHTLPRKLCTSTLRVYILTSANRLLWLHIL